MIDPGPRMMRVVVQLCIAAAVGAVAVGWWFFDAILQPYGLSAWRILNGD